MRFFSVALFLIFVLFLFSCTAGTSSQTSSVSFDSSRQTGEVSGSRAPVQIQHILQLDDFAQLERAGVWFQGMGFTESVIRENAGDYAGAVAAVYKELTWAYGMGLMTKEELEHAFLNILAERNEEPIFSAVYAVLAFSAEDWPKAAAGFEALRSITSFFDEEDEPDGFGRWMMLVCTLEKNRENRRAAAAYQSIRARYAHFPEYWYRGARVLSGLAAAEFAENCINIAPQGPFAEEARGILAVLSGLNRTDGLSIKTKAEIEEIISGSMRSGNPLLLESLLPLISLPDNPYTVFAVSALKALNTFTAYNEFFAARAALSNGRLAERLLYINRS